METITFLKKSLFFLKKVGVTNLLSTPEPDRATQSHPESPRAWKSHPSVTQSQPEPARVSWIQPELGESQWKFNIKDALRENLNSY